MEELTPAQVRANLIALGYYARLLTNCGVKQHTIHYIAVTQ
jgi:hypothetical protein